MKNLKTVMLAALMLLAVVPMYNAAQEKTKYPFETVRDRSSKLVAGEGDPGGSITADSYAFSVDTGAGIDDTTDGTTLLASPFLNNSSSQLAPIGFFFRFAGENFNGFSVNSNGFIRLGAVPPGQSSNVNMLSTTTNAPKIAPLWDTICYQAGGGAVGVKSRVHGVPGHRKLVIEWSGVTVSPNIVGPCTQNGMFQLWLFEGTGVIQFVYGSGATPATGFNGGYSVGMQSGPASNFASVTVATNTVSYTASNDNQFSTIAPGLSYIFTPQTPSAAPTDGNITGATRTSLTLNWTDNAINETAYVIRRSTDNVNFSVVSEIPAGSTSFTDTGLMSGTQYFYLVNAVTDGGVSDDLALSATTFVSLGGRVVTFSGMAIRNAIITLSGGNLTTPRIVQTGNFGTYQFDDLRPGDTYTITVSAKRYRFSPSSQTITPTGDVTNFDFVANPQD